MNFPRPTELPLHCTPSAAWSRSWNQLAAAADKQLCRKTRLPEQLTYLRANAPEIARIRDRVVIELNPSPCESLEIARYLGHIGYGIVPPTNGEHSQACRLLHTRQGLEVSYFGIDSYLEPGALQQSLLDRFSDRCVLINCNCLLDLLPLDFDYASRQKHLNLDVAANFMSLIHSLLCPSGLLLLGLGDSPAAKTSGDLLKHIAAENGLQLVRGDNRLQKWRKV